MQSREGTQKSKQFGTLSASCRGREPLLRSGIKLLRAIIRREPLGYILDCWDLFRGKAVVCGKPPHEYLMRVVVLAFALALPSTIRAQNVTAKVPCDASLLARHTYKPQRLIVHAPCISVTGTIVDATHGKRKQGCRVEADGDAHCWLHLDKGEEGLLNAKNRSDQGGNLVIEPICRYRVTQADAMEACKGWHQNLALPPPGSRVRVTGAYVFDAQHGHMEIHPITAIENLPR